MFKDYHKKSQEDYHSQKESITIFKVKQSTMGNLRRRAKKSSRKELTTEQIEEEKEKTRQRSYNRRHSTSDITPPIQTEHRNSMGSIMDTLLST